MHEFFGIGFGDILDFMTRIRSENGFELTP